MMAVKEKKVSGTSEVALKVTLVKSLIGASQDQRKIVASLGLRKVGYAVSLRNNDSVKGQIRKISHLLKVEVV
jgi:large subunit ribosomal protein L30